VWLLLRKISLCIGKWLASRASEQFLRNIYFNNSRTIAMETNNQRRDFIRLATIGSISGITLLSACKDEDDEDQKVSPPEDLMQEHGLLNRVLLIYDHCKGQLQANQSFPMEALLNSAGIIRTFVENYHEKQEEQYLFPRFQKANQLTQLVRTLLAQHQAGRTITDQLLQLTKSQQPGDTEKQQLIKLLADFNTMYRPHEAREDTILFPAFRKIVSHHEYDALGEEFEKNEQKLFGKNGFEDMVGKVAAIEKSLGIYELAQFTPKTS